MHPARPKDEYTPKRVERVITIVQSLPNSDPLIGNIIARYSINEKLGHGTYGTVYLATDMVTREKRAIKRLLTTECLDLIIIGKKHENLVEYFCHFYIEATENIVSSSLFIVFEYCEV